MGMPESAKNVYRSFGMEMFFIPNIGELLGLENNREVPKNWADYDFEGSTILVNAGEVIFVSLFMLSLFPVIWAAKYFLYQ